MPSLAPLKSIQRLRGALSTSPTGQPQQQKRTIDVLQTRASSRATDRSDVFSCAHAE
jgi:hypothetical protein